MHEKLIERMLDFPSGDKDANLHLDEMLNSVSAMVLTANIHRWIDGVRTEETRGLVRVTLHAPVDAQGLFGLVDCLGWFPSRVLWAGYSEKVTDKTPDKISKFSGDVIVEFEPRNDTEVYVNTKLYHATPTARLPKIKKIGLCPKTNNSEAAYPQRVYLANSQKAAEVIARQLAQYSGYMDWTILEVTLPPDASPMQDKQFADGYYTYKNIRPEYLKVMKEINFG